MSRVLPLIRMRVLQPVLWSKGTFLTPQHLQLQDRFIESLVQFRVDALHFRPYGFQALQMDHEALAGGNAGIARAEGLFPDGMPFEVPESDAAPPARPIAEAFEPGKDTLDVFLAVPEMKPGGVNVSVAEKGMDTRYLAEVTQVRDENTGIAERPVQVARKNLRILLEGESRQGYSMLRAGRVRRNEAGGYDYDPAFVPPLLEITASDYVMSVARRLLEVLSAKSSMLSGVRRQKNQSLADFTASDIANFWLLYSANTHLPLVRHLYETRRGHPEELFQAMLSLASVLTTFSMEIQARDLPQYDHDDLGPRLNELEDKLHYLLNTVVPSNFIALALKLVRPSIYGCSLDQDKYMQNTRMYLAVSAEMNEGELIQRAPKLIKACSATHIEHIVRQALPGVPMLHVVAPPSAIPVKLNYQYFSLSQSGLAWEAIERARNFAVYVPGDFPSPQLELIILLPG
jgi:type VI secretion system protein ImpJ